MGVLGRLLLLAAAAATAVATDDACPPGGIMALPNMPTTCMQCQPGRFLAPSDLGFCQPCQGGRYDNDSSAATECSACPAGTFSSRGATACAACAAGYADLDGSAVTPCLYCASGQYSAGSSPADGIFAVGATLPFACVVSHLSSLRPCLSLWCCDAQAARPASPGLPTSTAARPRPAPTAPPASSRSAPAPPARTAPPGKAPSFTAFHRRATALLTAVLLQPGRPRPEPGHSLR